MNLKLETKDLVLTRPNENQIEQYYNDIIGTNMFDTIIWEGPESVQDLYDFWDRNRKSSGTLEEAVDFAMIDKENSHYVGGCSLRPVGGDPNIIDVGIAIAPRFQGKSYGTQAMRAIVNEAFQNRQAYRVFGKVFVGNLASRKMFEKLDFSFEGTLRGIVKKRGQWLDEWVMAILKPDWQKSNKY